MLQILRQYRLDGIDLDIEEPTTFPSVRRLILRLRKDLGPQFLISLAPVATALLPDPRVPILFPVFGLLPSLPHLSGPDFSYFRLEADPRLQREIAWYNTQLYCGWGDASNVAQYDAIIRTGWDPSRVVLGVVTNPRNGAGHVHVDTLCTVLASLRQMYPNFGGVMGWEYFNSGLESKGAAGPWEWVKRIGQAIRTQLDAPPVPEGSKPRAKWKEEDVKWLEEMGVDRGRAEGALEAAGGNVEIAAGLLFDG